MVNLRKAQLELEAVYGAGPGVNANIYEPVNDSGESRRKLKLGRIQCEDANEGLCPLRDIRRVQDTFPARSTERSLSDVLIADARNDDNSIISQMTVLFHQLHNIVVSKLPERDLAASNSADKGFREFWRARNVVVDIYRRVIRHDLLKRLLHPYVYAHYDAKMPQGRFMRSSYSVPLEFAHAASRLGHAMIRPKYQISREPDFSAPTGRVIETNSSRSPTKMPLDEKWVVDWSLFFDMREVSEDASAPVNLSARLKPHVVTAMFAEGFVHNPLPEDGGEGIYLRDFLRAEASQIHSVDSLLNALKGKKSEVRHLVNASELLRKKSKRSEAIKQWLRQPSGNLSHEQVDRITDEPPLLFFILLEASKQQVGDVDGAHLGTLGSIIVAEAIFPALVRRPLFAGQSAKCISKQTRKDVNSIFGSAPPKTMAELLEFVAENHRVNQPP